MAIMYKKKHQKVNHNGEVKEVFIAKVAYGSYINISSLAKEISETTTASKSDVLLILSALEERISFHVSNGNVVKLELLGSFYPTIKATAVDSAEKVNQFSIINKGVRFSPSASFKDIIKKASLRLSDRRVFNANSHPNKKKNIETK